MEKFTEHKNLSVNRGEISLSFPHAFLFSLANCRVGFLLPPLDVWDRTSHVMSILVLFMFSGGITFFCSIFFYSGLKNIIFL